MTQVVVFELDKKPQDARFNRTGKEAPLTVSQGEKPDTTRSATWVV